MNITFFNNKIDDLINEIFNCLYFNHKNNKLKIIIKNILFYIDKISKNNININKTTHIFIDELPKIKSILNTDLKATYEGDPACKDYQEIILAYPGFFATFVYRIAHFFYENKIDYLPRILSEFAHSKTGIDINPCCIIGPYFFIDHGTGVVIGETSIIGHHVKIYQGVTIGAVSLKDGQKLKGIKRHPTIKNYVTIYSNSSILGGKTIIGNNVTIGSNLIINKSIKDNEIIKKE